MDLISVDEIPTFTDDQLRVNLKKCGLNVGPITATTRRLYEKRLRNYLEGNGDQTVNVTSNSILADIANDSTAHKSRSSPRKKPTASSITIEPIMMPEPKTTTTTTTTTAMPSRPQSQPRKEPEQVMRAPIRSEEPVYHHQTEIRPKVTSRVVEEPIKIVPPLHSTSHHHHQQQQQQQQHHQYQQQQQQQPQQQPKPAPQTVIHNLNNFNFNPTEMPLYTSTLKPHHKQQHADENRAASAVAPAPPTITSTTTTNQVPFSSAAAKSYGLPDDLDINPRYTASPSVRRNPSPVKDKFAERLINYGLLRNENDPVSTLTSASSNTPSANRFVDPALRNRLIRPEMRDSPRIEPRQPLASRVEKPTSSTFANAASHQTPKKPETEFKTNQQAATTTTTGTNQSQFNLRYLITAVIMTIIVYFIIISMQSNPANPVEI